MSRIRPSPPKLRRGISSEKGAPQRPRQWVPPRTPLLARPFRGSLLIIGPIDQTFFAFTSMELPRRPHLAPSGFTDRHLYKPFATLGNLGGLVLLRCMVQAPRPVSGGGFPAPTWPQRSPILSREETDALNHGRFLLSSPATHPRIS